MGATNTYCTLFASAGFLLFLEKEASARVGIWAFPPLKVRVFPSETISWHVHPCPNCFPSGHHLFSLRGESGHWRTSVDIGGHRRTSADIVAY